MLSRGVWLSAVVVLAAAQSPGQESRPALDLLVERANHVSPYIAAQATKALEKEGARALPAMIAFVARRTHHALSAPAVTWLGTIDAPSARKILREALADRAFAWRPYAARALALHAAEEDRASLVTAAGDRVAQVRDAALRALAALAHVAEPSRRTELLALLRGALADEDFDVRMRGAEELMGLDDHSGVGVLVEALGLARKFFDQDFGGAARARAWSLLRPVLGPTVTFDPEGLDAVRAAQLIAVARRVAELPGAPFALAPTAHLGPDVGQVVFGLEMRSCRTGDLFVRLTSAGDLVLGNCNLRVARLPEELRAELTKTYAAVLDLPPVPLYGRPGCDFERFIVPDERGLVRITVGPEGRPASLKPLTGAIEAALLRAFGPEVSARYGEIQAGFDPVDGDG